MTWHAQDGKIVLAGGEAKLFQEAFLSICDDILTANDDEDSFFEAATVFDNMSRSQQVASLEVVARYLFHPTPECLPLTAWSEATLASVLQEVRNAYYMEEDEKERDAFRRVIVDALEMQDEVELIEDPEEWNGLLEAYDERFLWDSDYADQEIPDLAPGPAGLTRQMLGILDDYYTAVPPDLSAGESLHQGTERVERAINGE